MDDRTILLEDGRFSYTYVFKPYTNRDGKQSYTSHWLFPSNHRQFGALQALIRKVAAAEFGPEAENVLKQLGAQDKLCIHKGDVNKPGVDAYKGMLYISASRNAEDGPPRLVDENRNEIGVAAGKIYSGGRGNIIVRIWAQNNQYGRRINANLQGLQHTGHDAKLSTGGGVAAADEFKVVATDADGAAPAAIDEGGLI